MIYAPIARRLIETIYALLNLLPFCRCADLQMFRHLESIAIAVCFASNDDKLR